jgi:YesN/AraC family two-component response regulator
MFKVLLVDDEPVILEGLRKIVPWADYNCETPETARDGLDAREKIETLRPDIVFTDIKMPNEDGLTLIAALRSSYPNMQIALLTGYRNFEYAQAAIKFGVARFLLKPSKMTEIIEALEAMTAKLSPDAPPNQEAGSFIANEALKFMRANYNKKITLEDAAKNAYVSKWHLSRLLSEFTKKSFLDNLNEIRISKAKTLLLDPSLKVGDISDMVGFSDASHFAKLFKKFAGVSANEYRNKISKKIFS